MGDTDLDRKKKVMTDKFISKQDAINIANDWLLDCFKVQKQDRSCGLIRRVEDSPSADVVPVNREKLMAVLRDFFSIGDSYTYELTRVKSAFEVGTMSLDDFKEWEEEDISCLCDYILRELRRGNKDG